MWVTPVSTLGSYTVYSITGNTALHKIQVDLSCSLNP